MTTALQRVTTRDLTTVQNLVALSEQISRMDSPEQLQDTRSQIEAAKAFAKAKSMADDVATKLSILSIQCALRIGEMGDNYLQYITPKTHQQHVEYLLKWRSYRDVMELAQSAGGPVSLFALVNLVRKERAEQENRKIAKGITSGYGKPQYDFDGEGLPQPGQVLGEFSSERDARAFLKGRNEAIHALLSGREGPFRVSEIAEEYMEALTRVAQAGEDSDKIVDALGDPSLREGIAEMVRYELRFARDDSGRQVYGQDIPMYVTYYDEAAREYVRLHWKNATLSQLKGMAAYRKAQANSLVAAAEELSDLVSSLESRAQNHYEYRRDGDLPLLSFKTEGAPQEGGR